MVRNSLTSTWSFKARDILSLLFLTSGDFKYVYYLFSENKSLLKHLIFIESENIKNIGLFSAIENIQSQITLREKNEYLDDLIFQRKIQLGIIRQSAIPPITDRTEEQIINTISRKANLIDGIIIFKEFMKEYTYVGNQQKQVIKMMHE